MALEILELETFIDSQPAPREIRRRIEEGVVEFQNLWKKSTGSQKKRLLATLFETIYVYAEELGVMFNGATAAVEKVHGAENKKAMEDRPKAFSSNLISLSDHRLCASDLALRAEGVKNAWVVKSGRRDWI